MAKNEIHVTYTISDEDLEDILITALEGGIGYWACLDNTGHDWEKQPKETPTSVWAWKILNDGGTLRFLDEEDDSAEYTLDMASFFSGIGLSISKGVWSGDMDGMDAVRADCIIQFAVFGDVIYG